MAYVARQDLLTYFSSQAITKFLDDDGDGQEDTGLLAQIVADASLEVDGRLATTYQVPFADPAPSKVRAAALIFVAEAFYARRNVPPERNPFSPRADYWRRELEGIGTSGHGLDANTNRVVPPVGWIAEASVLTDNSL